MLTITIKRWPRPCNVFIEHTPVQTQTGWREFERECFGYLLV
jgi:hypothetical protein